MPKASATPDALLSPAVSFEPLFTLSTLFAQNALRLQQLQLDACMAWQRSLAATGQELFDEWACRFAGGAPIDG
ncbi:hypothetical protein [Piscinibacter sp. HJYY11]|uniref:hypothetical protein n=1 Tax=Piscinibacter sp. HJYY11 TaxID=2801333 RepID=UPI00191EE931|nr:hypothetical protein [Piscinibacter sp. HJYY11]MBL0726581.1 hypothetical protein [Piscinibacter sp. HJYY11]